MGWTSRALDVPVQGGPYDDTVINVAPYNARQAAGGGAIRSAAHGAAKQTQSSDEIRRRQLSLLARYVVSTRAR